MRLPPPNSNDRVSPAWVLAAVVNMCAACYFALQARTAELLEAKAKADVAVCTEERRRCGADVAWCQQSVKGSIDYVTKLLREGL